jgi:cyclohexanone monooxygenase
MPDGLAGKISADGSGSAPAAYDVIIIGAGLSGIGAACRLKTQARGSRFIILEAREAIGGTWDLFRYPGVRSDSDMFTLGYPFRPWLGLQALVPGRDILTYIRETAAAYDVGGLIKFGHKLRHASWSSQTARWTLDVETSDGSVELTASMLLMCGGYYDYAQGHAPNFPGEQAFQGSIVHPQFWPEGLDYADKRVVVIGSGATAVTLVPALAAKAAHVVMLQRSPSYVVSRPSVDRFAAKWRRFLPSGVVGRLARVKNILETIMLYRLARSKPIEVKAHIIRLAARQLGADYDVAQHFSPRYDPWDQRLCLVPDGDLFKAIRNGRASVETEAIARFTASGIMLESGREIAADVIVTATGLRLTMMGGATMTVDGKVTDYGAALCYKGMMLSGVPNMLFVIGYTNASWTLKADLVARFTCRLLKLMRRRGYGMVVAPADETVSPAPLLDFTSGYVQRASAVLPKQGTRAPWRLHQNYIQDMLAMRFGRLQDRVLRFERVRRP